MNIAIIGATGMVGSSVVAEAVRRGEHVDAYSRKGDASANELVTPHALQFADTAAVIDVINSHDVTLITVAGRDNYEAVREAHHVLIEAKPQGRFIVVGGAGALQADANTRLFDTPQFPEAYLPEAKTFGAILDDYRANAGSLQWSMIAPAPAIAPGKRTGLLATELDTPAGEFVSSQDFAIAVVNEMEQPQHVGERFTVASVHADAARA